MFAGMKGGFFNSKPQKKTAPKSKKKEEQIEVVKPTKKEENPLRIKEV